MKGEREPMRIEDEDILGPADAGTEKPVQEVTDSQIMGPADEAEEVSDSHILGPADAPERTQTVEFKGEMRPIAPKPEKTIILEQGTGPAESPEAARERQDGMVAKLDGIHRQMAEAAGEAAHMVPMGEAAPSEEELEMAKLAKEARELAERADDILREMSLKALAGLEPGSEDRLTRAQEFLGKWPQQAKEFEKAGLSEVELAIVALRMVREDSEGFIRAIAVSDLGLDAEDKAAIAMELRTTSPNELPKALWAMRLPTEHVTELVKGLPTELRDRVFSMLDIPTVGQEIAPDVSGRMEEREREDARIREFAETANAVTLEVMRAFPERLERERERAAIERGLLGKMTEALDYGKTRAAPMVIAIDGRELPAIYKAISREVASREAFQEEEGQDLRPGIAAETVPSREWLAYQIDKALQLDIVPPTVMREGPEGQGSVQDWRVSEGLDDEPYFRWAREDETFRNELAKVAFLDRAIENTDRHQKNFLRSPDGKMIAIDNGLSHARPDSNSDHTQSFPIYALEGEPIPPAILQAAERFKANPELRSALKKAFDLALGEDSKRAWMAFESKLGSMAKIERFPTIKELEKEGSLWHLMHKHKIENHRRLVDKAA